MDSTGRAGGGRGDERADFDLVVLGAGGAGLNLVLAIDRWVQRTGATPPRIAVIDPEHRRGADRTWCWWTRTPQTPFGSLIHRHWQQIEVFAPGGDRLRPTLQQMSYVMLRSQDFYAEADRALQRLDAVRVRDTARLSRTATRADTVTVEAGTWDLHASWVFDSRPATPARAARTALLQHFRGWTVRLPQDVLDPSVATLMDFRVPQPPRAVAFGYVLPLSSRRALVEYTQFSRRRLSGAQYEAALRAYLTLLFGDLPVQVEAVEDGVIPMNDARLARQAHPRVFRLGTAGGATRGSTGYTFAAMVRQAEEIAQAWFTGAVPRPSRPYPLRHGWMDAVLLRAIDRGLVNGADLFTQLFRQVPAELLFDFLDGTSSPLGELRVMAQTPMVGMLAASAGDAAQRLRDRVHLPPFAHLR